MYPPVILLLLVSNYNLLLRVTFQSYSVYVRYAVWVFARVSLFGAGLHVCQPSNFRHLIYPPCIFGCFCQIVWPIGLFYAKISTNGSHV